MAGLGWRTFTAGAVLTAAQVQGYLQDQAVMKFATVVSRNATIASPSQGMMSFITNTNSYYQYYEVYNATTNPGGASVAGWYPAEGTVLFAGKRSNTGVSIPNNAYTVVSFNTFSCAGSTSNFDTIQINSATAPSTFTVRQAGWYRLSMNVPMVAWSSTAGTNRAMASNRNSATYSTGTLTQLTELGTVGPQVVTDTATVLLAANDVIRFFVFQDSGGAATNSDTNFSIEYLRPASV
jgi:hypothetical protein